VVNWVVSASGEVAMGARVAVVTGAASGIGLATAARLARDGARVALVDLDGDGAEARAAALRGDGLDAIAVAGDVADRASVEQAFDQVRRELGSPSILVNNAGKALFRRFLDIEPTSWADIVEVNLTSVFHCCQVALPDMVDAGWGRIVNISSSSTHSGQPFMAAYVAAKSGVVGLTKSLALEYGPAGITVNTIPPGFIDTPMLQRDAAKGRLGPGGIEAAIERTPVRRAGQPEDIAAACAFLVSDDAGYITGQVIGVNGGRNT
jgi:NAD(P)-dependent dehydrogenase (short-subunit alcohol dehydrogenase family)